MAAPFRRCVAQLAVFTRQHHGSAMHHPWASPCVLQTCSTAHRLDGAAVGLQQQHEFHTATSLFIFRNTEFDETPSFGVEMHSKKWDKYNTVVYPPQEKDDPMRPAEICHSRFNIKYSPKKMWFIAAMIRGMSISEAKKQLSFYRRKGAQSVLEVLEEAQEIAVRDHNVEFESNLWICDSFAGKGQVVKGLRKHMGPRYGLVHYRYVHYFVRLREGSPPEHYYPPPLTGYEKMEDYIKEKRKRRIVLSL